MKFYFHCLHTGRDTLKIINEYLDVMKGKELTLSIISPDKKFKEVYAQIERRNIVLKETIESSNPKLFEHLILNKLSGDAQDMDDDEMICYLQAKGTGRNTEINAKWRRYLLNFTRTAVVVGADAKFSNVFDAAGCLWTIDNQNKRAYFAGNHWFATAKWIKHLLPYGTFSQQYDNNRFCAEFWINSKSDLIPFVLDGKIFTYPQTYSEFNNYLNGLK